MIGTGFNLSTFDERWITRLRLNYAFTTELFVSSFTQLNINREVDGGGIRTRAVVSNFLIAYVLQQGHSFSSVRIESNCDD